MRFRHKMIGCLCFFSFILCSFCGCRNNLRYPQGKDSHEAFGDGEYQLLHGQGEEMNLHNCAVNTSVLNYVQSYKTVGEKVYFFGKTPPDLRSEYDMFLILEPKTNAVQMILDDTTVPEEEIERVKRYVRNFLPEKPITVLLLNQINHVDRNTLEAIRGRFSD